MNKQELGKKIRDLRVRKGISQGILARGIGLKTHAAVSDIERGKTSVSVEQLDAIVQVLGVSVKDILESEIISQGSSQNRDSSPFSADFTPIKTATCINGDFLSAYLPEKNYYEEGFLINVTTEDGLLFRFILDAKMAGSLAKILEDKSRGFSIIRRETHLSQLTEKGKHE